MKLIHWNALISLDTKAGYSCAIPFRDAERDADSLIAHDSLRCDLCLLEPIVLIKILDIRRALFS